MGCLGTFRLITALPRWNRPCGLDTQTAMLPRSAPRNRRHLLDGLAHDFGRARVQSMLCASTPGVGKKVVETAKDHVSSCCVYPGKSTSCQSIPSCETRANSTRHASSRCPIWWIPAEAPGTARAHPTLSSRSSAAYSPQVGLGLDKFRLALRAAPSFAELLQCED